MQTTPTVCRGGCMAVTWITPWSNKKKKSNLQGCCMLFCYRTAWKESDIHVFCLPNLCRHCCRFCTASILQVWNHSHRLHTFFLCLLVCGDEGVWYVTGLAIFTWSPPQRNWGRQDTWPHCLHCARCFTAVADVVCHHGTVNAILLQKWSVCFACLPVCLCVRLCLSVPLSLSLSLVYLLSLRSPSLIPLFFFLMLHIYLYRLILLHHWFVRLEFLSGSNAWCW